MWPEVAREHLKVISVQNNEKKKSHLTESEVHTNIFLHFLV